MVFDKATSGSDQPRYLSADNDPLFRYHQWKANLRILDVDEIESVPCVPRSRPFVERLIGTVRREFLDRTLFWNARDLERKLVDFETYYNQNRTRDSINGITPAESAGGDQKPSTVSNNFRWQSHCRGPYQLPVAA